MGFGLRFREKVKQVGKKNTTQPDKNGFVATNYERIQLTYDEAAAFADSLKVIRKRISEAHAARTKMLKDIEKTLTGTLPRVHEIDPVTGEHNTVEAAPEQHEGVGDYVHQGTLYRLVEENDIKVQSQVYDPIDKWISEVDLFKGKVKILENLRLELDGSRRDHINIENKIAKQEAKQSEIDAKHTTHIQSKDASIAGKRTAFEQFEAQVYEELVNLIGETGVLHTVLDRAIKLEIDIYEKAADPISTTTARLENLSTASGVTSPASSTQYSAGGAGHATSFTPTGAGTGAGYGQGAGTNYGSSGTNYGTSGTSYGTGGAGGKIGAAPGSPRLIAGTGQGGTGQPNPQLYAAQTVSYPSAPTSSIPSSEGAKGAGGSQVGYERPYGA